MISGVRGMGGVGKTELAYVLAKRLKDRFPDAQIAFNLRGASDADSSTPATPVEALQHVIRSFHPEAKLPEEVDELQGVYHSVLDGKRVLLLMDNALDAQQLAPLTSPPDGCALMVTSRHHFTLSGMEPINLDTLQPEEARDLLVGICPRIGDHADALAKRCGYLPLALRLAASALARRLALRGEEAFADLVIKYSNDLGNETDRLAKLDANKPKEALGIEASLAISYRQIDESLQRRWRALAVFPGDFDEPAAGSVWELDDEEQRGTALDDLLAASMVQCEEATNRFRLHDLARDYARARLTGEECAGDEQRHAAHYAGVLRSAKQLYKEGGSPMLQGLALFDREWGNIRTGQAWATAHCEADHAAARLCCDYPYIGAYCLALRLNSRDLIVWFKAGLVAARKLKDRSAEGNHLGTLGLAYAALGETRKAIEFFEQTLAIHREIGDRRGEGSALGNLGNAYADLGETHKAIEYYEQQLVITREIGDRLGEGRALHNLAGGLAKAGRCDEAIAHAEQAVEIFEQLESPYATAARALLEWIRAEKDET